MSISSQISRIIELRNQIRNKLTIMGLVTSNSKLEDLTEAILDIPMQDARTYTPGTRNQTISAGMYLTGTQTIQGDTNLIAENIADGVSIFGVAGTHTGGTDTSDATMTSGSQMLSGVTAYSKGIKYTGSIADYDGTVVLLTITFTLDEIAEPLQADSGMTWRQWCSSAYNTMGITITSNNYVRYESFSVCYSDLESVDPDDSIIANYEYVCF